MALKYALYLNNLTPDPNDYSASVMDARTRDLDYLIKKMVRPGGGLTEDKVRSVLAALERELVEIIEEGDSINLSLFQSRISIQGVFHSEGEAFDRKKHALVLHLSPGDALSKALDQVKVEKVPASEKRPVLQSFFDLKSDTRNEQMTPGKMGMIKGLNLKVNPEDAQQGVFFIDSKAKETRVQLFSHNLPSELTFEIPEPLAKGTYQLEVRNIQKNHKEVRRGSLDYPLVVV